MWQRSNKRPHKETSGDEGDREAMNNVGRRLERLEERFGSNQPSIVLVVCDAGRQDECMEVLRESGFRCPPGINVVDFTKIPAGLNAEETKRFLREHGAELC